MFSNSALVRIEVLGCGSPFAIAERKGLLTVEIDFLILQGYQLGRHMFPVKTIYEQRKHDLL
jgi:hypothetical protein